MLKCFLPNLNTEKLSLPKEKCAGREELKTISMAHKATLVNNLMSKEKIHINTNGTTKLQKKLGATAVNGIVLSVNELADGTADSVIKDISKELHSLREMGKALNFQPNQLDIIGFLDVRFCFLSKTIKQTNRTTKRRKCKEFGSATHDIMDIVENFCSMHLGINLRMAFLDGIRNVNEQPSDSGQREYHTTDVFVHEFCKLFGKYGTPEYGCGVLTFPDFLAIKLQDSSIDKEYFLSCKNTTLERQIGNRYFVTAANAAKILHLIEAAIQFLEYTRRHQGNKLEKDVYCKLLDPSVMMQLKVYALMFITCTPTLLCCPSQMPSTKVPLI